MADIVTVLFSPRIRVKELARLCRRLSTSLAAGVDMRAIWKREAKSSERAVLLRRFASIHDAVAAGEDLADAVEDCGDFFPELFRQLVRVGEETGTNAEVLARLADHYDARIKRRHLFMAAMTWPAIELSISLVVIGLAIWIPSLIGDGTTDILGFGLIGTQGLALYLAFLSGVGIVLLLTIRAVQRGVIWIQPLQRLVLMLPGIGPPLQTMALSRMSWVLYLTLNTDMDVRRALRLALMSTNHARYLDHIPIVDRWIDQGSSIHDALANAGGYPPEFLDALQIGEDTGQIVESMERLSKQYEQRSRMALAALMTLLGVLVWAIIGLLIIIMVLQIFMTSILGPIYDAMN